MPAIFGLQLSLEMAKTLALHFDSTIESTIESPIESTIESTQVGRLSCESCSSKLHLVHTTLN